MSTKYFHWDGGVTGILAKERWVPARGGNPVEFTFFNAQVLAILAWDALTAGQQRSLVARLVVGGWIEDEESKPSV